MRHEIISLKDLKGLYLLRRRFKKWRQNEWKNHVVYVYGPFDRVWAEKPPLRFSWIKEYMFIYLQTDYEMHWILRIFYRIFWFPIFNTCSYGELFTGVSPLHTNCFWWRCPQCSVFYRVKGHILVHILVCALTAAFRDGFLSNFVWRCILVKSRRVLFLVTLPPVFRLL